MHVNAEIPCPACGFLTLVRAYGSYAICSACGWEDDQVQVANPASGGGANSESLIAAQEAALARYPIGFDITDGVRRDPRWRPLSEDEQKAALRERAEAHWRNKGIVDLADCYWLRRPSPDAG